MTVYSVYNQPNLGPHSFPTCDHSRQNPLNSNSNRISTLVFDDQSFLKGVLWSAVGFKVGAATLYTGVMAAMTSPLMFTPFLFAPVGFGVATLGLASLTGTCVDNALYHLGSRRVVILQN